MNNHSAFERLLAILPSENRDSFCGLLSDDCLLELSCTSHFVENILQQSNQYWRGRYGQHFHWRYVDNEKACLLWYRNRVWSADGRPPNSTVDILGESLEHLAFLGINWRQAYKYRRAIESNWRRGKYRRLSHDTYSNEFIAYSFENSIGTSNVASRFRNLLHHSYLMFTNYNPSGDNSTQNDSEGPLQPIPLDINKVIPKLLQPQISNECFAVVKYQEVFYLQPTYASNQWTSITLPLISHEPVNFMSRLDFGRWAILMKNASPTRFWLVNLVNSQHCEIDAEIIKARYVEEADEHGVTFGKYQQVNQASRLSWSHIYYQVTDKGLATKTLRAGSFFLEPNSMLQKICRLGPGYVYAKYALDEYITMGVFTTNETCEGQRAIRYFPHGKSAHRIDRNKVLVVLGQTFEVMELSTGNVLRSFNNESAFDIYPILGNIGLNYKHAPKQEILDIASGKPITEIDVSKEFAGNVFCLCPTFFANMVDKTANVDIFDFSDPI